jgi:hypothetical protein
MYALLALAAVTQQVETVRIPPPVAPPARLIVRDAPLGQIKLALPDLVIGKLRMVDDVTPEFEVRNRGIVAATGPIRVSACVYLGKETNGVYYTNYCAALRSVGTIQPGASKWVRFECFLDGRGPTEIDRQFGGPTGPACVPLAFTEQPVSRFTAYVDPAPDAAERARRSEPKALRTECGDDFGCVREANERNNDGDFTAPFPS